jgi:asparagine synthetase B (glutamine-hydrolysing)
MCGLVGILGCKGPDEERRAPVHAMAEPVVHRGPDGEVCTARKDCALGHRRLAFDLWCDATFSEGVLVPIAKSRKVVL